MLLKEYFARNRLEFTFNPKTFLPLLFKRYRNVFSNPFFVKSEANWRKVFPA